MPLIVLKAPAVAKLSNVELGYYLDGEPLASRKVPVSVLEAPGGALMVPVRGANKSYHHCMHALTCKNIVTSTSD